jgi:hypothetical protein
MRGRQSRITKLPGSLIKHVESRLRRPRFKDYRGLAEWLRQRGHDIPISSLRRRRRLFMPKARPTPLDKAAVPAVPETPRDDPAVTTEGLMRLTQQKLSTALADIKELGKVEMSRLAHAVAHLTQAAISLQRWNDEANQRADKKKGSQAKSLVRGGLSRETSQALRNALLGIAPFNPEEVAAKARHEMSEINSLGAVPEAGEFKEAGNHSDPPGVVITRGEDRDNEDPDRIKSVSTPRRS